MPKLIVKSNPNQTADNPGRYHIHLRSDGGTDTRHQIVGFSYFGEVGGLRVIPQQDYVLLEVQNGSSDWTDAISPTSDRNVVRMSYQQWFDLLADHKINFSRIFVYPDVEAGSYPFHKVGPQQYNVSEPGTTYLTSLQRYIEYAQSRNVIVQISLAGIQTLRPAKWKVHPMYSERNTSDFLNTPDGRKKFFVLREPVGAVDTEFEWNYQVQSKSLDWILNATRGAWNVVYELFNEPGGAADPAPEQMNWLVTMAKWLDARLRDPATGGHTHLIALNASNEMLEANGNNILKPMLFDGTGTRRTHPLIDVFSFHGSQWGGNWGVPSEASRPNTPENPSVIKNQTRNAVNLFYTRPIDAAGNKVQGSPVALICDSDAHYRAQDNPQLYATVVLKQLKLDYNHRWGHFWLTQRRVCTQVKAIKAAVQAPAQATLEATA